MEKAKVYFTDFRTPAGGDGLRVYITYDGQPLLDAPFGSIEIVRVEEIQAIAEALNA